MAFHYRWPDGGAESTKLRHSQANETLAIAVFSDIVDDTELSESARLIRRLAREVTKADDAQHPRVGRIIRLVGEHERLKRTPTWFAGSFAPPSREALRLADWTDVGNAFDLLTPPLRAIPDLELAALLALADLTAGPNGHADFAADRLLIVEALLGTCHPLRGPRQPRANRRRRADGHRASNELRRRLLAAIDGLSAEDRRQLDRAIAADAHLMCGLALAAASVMDTPHAVAEIVGEAIARSIAEMYFKESPGVAREVGVYVGALVIGEVITSSLGVDAAHASAQAARVVAVVLCPNPSQHGAVVEGVRTCARSRLEDEAVARFFEWASAISAA